MTASRSLLHQRVKNGVILDSVVEGLPSTYSCLALPSSSNAICKIPHFSLYCAKLLSWYNYYHWIDIWEEMELRYVSFQPRWWGSSVMEMRNDKCSCGRELVVAQNPSSWTDILRFPHWGTAIYSMWCNPNVDYCNCHFISHVLFQGEQNSW